MGRRAAYTLLELMIVLAILAGVTAISWPALMRPWSRNLAQQAAQQLTAALLETRTRAIEESRVYRLRWVEGTGEFQIDAPLIEPTSGPVEPVDAMLPIGPATLEPPLRHRPAPHLLLDQLVHGVRFPSRAPGKLPGRDEQEEFPEVIASARVEPSRADLPKAPTSQTSPRKLADSSRWSEPVWFYPDGRTSNGQWTLVSEEGYQVEVALRGLTGTVRVGSVRAVPASDESKLEDVF